MSTGHEALLLLNKDCKVNKTSNSQTYKPPNDGENYVFSIEGSTDSVSVMSIMYLQ